MSKYVRLKEGKIIDLTNKDYFINENDLVLHEQYDTVGSAPADPKSMVSLSVAIIEHHNEYNFVGIIEKHADTIEELCDLVIYTTWSGDKGIDEINELKLHKNNFLNGYYSDLKLAIWTNKGLIYVAKMNEKGELELL